MNTIAIFDNLLTPSHFDDWYTAAASQGTHLIFGVMMFALLGWLDMARGVLFGREPLPMHHVMVAAMIPLAGWEFTSLAVYGGSFLDRLTNIAFMTAGVAIGWAIWSHRWRLMGAAAVVFIVALLLHALERL